MKTKNRVLTIVGVLALNLATACQAGDRSLGTNGDTSAQGGTGAPGSGGTSAPSGGSTGSGASAGTGALAGTGGTAGAGAVGGTGGSETNDAGTTDGGAEVLKLYLTCGAPVCMGYTGGSGTPLCTTEQLGDPCSVDGQKCDPQSACDSLYICAASDPRMKPHACPISRRRYKEAIHYLAPIELARYRDELLAMKLATWKYKHDPSKQRLGFMIDDNEGSAAVDAQGDLVDLYGYTSMAVATIQLQARQIAVLEREMAEMRKTLARASRAPAQK